MPPVTTNNLVLTITRNSNMDSSARDTILIQVQADETQDINNLVSVNSTNYDPDLSNNQAMVMSAVTDVADLNITKEFGGGPYIAGNSYTFWLNVTNNGPSVAENVVVKDYLPSDHWEEFAQEKSFLMRGVRRLRIRPPRRAKPPAGRGNDLPLNKLVGYAPLAVSILYPAPVLCFCVSWPDGMLRKEGC